MNEQTHGWTNEWTDKRTDERMNDIWLVVWESDIEDMPILLTSVK